jgi:hypothetical protein
MMYAVSDVSIAVAVWGVATLKMRARPIALAREFHARLLRNAMTQANHVRRDVAHCLVKETSKIWRESAVSTTQANLR